jgi:hypothetical protein
MNYLKKFNESISYNIVDDVYYLLLELNDLGFRIKVEKEKSDDSNGKHTLHKKDSLLISIDGHDLANHREQVKETILRVLEFLKENKFKIIQLNTSDYKINKFIELVSRTKSITQVIDLKAKN